MAQTHATSKACRLVFSWIMQLAGYSVTPAEEMIFATDSKPAPNQSRGGGFKKEQAPQANHPQKPRK